MLFSLWTAKAGAGATTVAIGLAARLARTHRVLLVDLGGDLPAAFGVAEPELGLTDWLAAESSEPAALDRLEVEVDHRLSLLPLGASTDWSEDRGRWLWELLAADHRDVVVDVGCVEPDPAGALGRLRREAASGPDASLLVLRPTYLALRRARAARLSPTGVVLVEEQARSLGAREVSSIVSAPVLARVEVDAAITRVIDGGVDLRRVPRPFVRALGGVA